MMYFVSYIFPERPNVPIMTNITQDHPLIWEHKQNYGDNNDCFTKMGFTTRVICWQEMSEELDLKISDLREQYWASPEGRRKIKENDAAQQRFALEAQDHLAELDRKRKGGFFDRLRGMK